MNNHRNIPAGLLDQNFEFFNDPRDPEICYCLTDGRVYGINGAPDYVLEAIDADMTKHPVKMEGLVLLGYETQEAQREKYCSCCFGAFDGQPDAVNGILQHSEFWPCPHRGVCPVEGRLCDGLLVGAGNALTRREIDVLMLVANCDLDKEIADKLRISQETVKVHLKNIREKSGMRDKKDLIKLAYQKNLIS